MSKSQKKKIKYLENKAKDARKKILQASYQAGVGHIGSALSIADIMTVLYHSVLNINSKKPLNKTRDRFILSKGHAGLALYVALHQRGFISRKKLYTFCKNEGYFGLHPEYNPKAGIEFSTGSLGHGLSAAAGMALGLNKDYKRKTPKIYVLLSDAELNSGSTWEAVIFAAHHKLDNLTVIIDDNSLQAFGRTEEILNMRSIRNKWQEFGWKVKAINGHSMSDLVHAMTSTPYKKEAPSLVLAKTFSGKGVSFMEDTMEWHYYSMDENQFNTATNEI
jgi:transketolase